jgi:YfiR/HmsC-like
MLSQSETNHLSVQPAPAPAKQQRSIINTSLCSTLLAMTLITGSTPVFADPASNEQALTVAFLYNFLKFTEWPQGVISNEITLCVSDSTEFGAELDAIAGKLAQNKSVRIQRIELGESPKSCQLLFLPREEKPVRIQQWLKNIANTPVLMVSNSDEFLDMGGMIALIDDGNRLQFEVNLERVRPTGLKLRAQLLKIARDVRGN